jgi:hypothetical protein
MKMRSYSAWALALVIGAGIFAIVRNGDAASRQDTSVRKSSAAFRDGAYLGKLAAERGEAPHMALARWTSNTDRNLFAAGYDQAYSVSLSGSDFARDQNNLAAFRDGLYLGKLDAERGNALHIAAGRWGTNNNRAAFVQGYNQAYRDSNFANTVSDNAREAFLIH